MARDRKRHASLRPSRSNTASICSAAGRFEIFLTRRVLLIANPAARRGARFGPRAVAAFRSAGVDCDFVLTEYPGHAAELARDVSQGYWAVFSLGGDGTAMEVVSALAWGAIPVGILAGGTGNLIAQALGIPLRIEAAVGALLDGDEAMIDLGALPSGRRFAFAAGVGIDATMVGRTPPRLKRRIGVVAYVLYAMHAALRRDPFAVRVTVDGVTIEREAVMVMVTNFGVVLQRLFTLGPGIREDDGVLDLCVFSPRGIVDAIVIAWRLLCKDFRTDPRMYYRAGRMFRIETDPPRLAQADGELLGMTPLEIRVEPRVARLLVPRSP
ncbi:MAG: hypothetical protein NVS1B4_00490 [Gemmatimonadaceae bacterium]